MVKPLVWILVLTVKLSDVFSDVWIHRAFLINTE